MKNILIAIILITLGLTSCQPCSKEVENALELAGNNRSELESVLNFYKFKDRKKYEAACFLIINMQYHNSLNDIVIDKEYDRFFMESDSLFCDIFKNMNPKDILSFKSKLYDSVRLSMKDKYDLLPNAEIKKTTTLSDLQCIRADFLIDNIESAFDEWEHNPLLRNMDFETFKEFILPYRTNDESILYKRSDLRKRFKWLLKDSTDIRYTIEQYKAFVNKSRWINQFVDAKEQRIGLNDIFLPKFKMDCYNMNSWTCNIFRACGIPIIFEYTPQWKDRDNPHFWSCSPDSDQIYKPFSAPDNNLLEDWESDIKYAGKVYRKTFAANKNTPYFLKGKEEYIPETLESPLLKDQTFRYHQTITLRIPFEQAIPNKLAYLCFFNKEEELNPVAWGIIDIKNKEIVFEQVPLNTLFFPVYYDENNDLTPITFPFILHTKGEVKSINMPLTSNKENNIVDLKLINDKLYSTKNNKDKSSEFRYISIAPDYSKFQTLHILRKYPEKRRMKMMQEKLIGGVFIAGNTDNGKFDTLFTLKESPLPYLQEIQFINEKKYHYYKFSAPNRGSVNISELEFIGKANSSYKNIHPSPLPIFYEETNTIHDKNLIKYQGDPLKTGTNYETAFDGNYDTYVGSSSVGMFFPTPVTVTHIRFAPRNANNIINPGDRYALFYYDAGWKQISIIEAKYNYLLFENVPSNTIYWLRNLSQGNEELPFFYHHGKQLFIHVDQLEFD